MRPIYRLLVLISAGLFFIDIQLTSAQEVQDDRKVASFENVIISASDNTHVHISYDKSRKIIVKADGRFIHKVKTIVSGNTLNVRLCANEVGNAKIEIYITSPKVKKVVISGSGQVDVTDGFSNDDLQALGEENYGLCS